MEKQILHSVQIYLFYFQVCILTFSEKIDKMRFYQRWKIQWRVPFRKKKYGNWSHIISGIEKVVFTNSEENKMCTVWQKSNILFYGERGSKVNNERLQTPIWYNYRISEELLAEFYLMSTDFSKCVFKTLGWVGSYFCNTESAVIREGRKRCQFYRKWPEWHLSFGHYRVTHT